MFRNALAAAAVVIVGIVLVAVGQEKQAAPKAPAGADPDFSGKVVYVLLKDPNKATMLQKARVQHLGSRAFLVGQYAPRTDDEERRDEIYWHPVEDIVMLVEYKNLAVARKAISAAGEGQR